MHPAALVALILTVDYISITTQFCLICRISFVFDFFFTLCLPRCLTVHRLLWKVLTGKDVRGALYTVHFLISPYPTCPISCIVLLCTAYRCCPLSTCALRFFIYLLHPCSLANIIYHTLHCSSGVVDCSLVDSIFQLSTSNIIFPCTSVVHHTPAPLIQNLK